MLLNFVSWLGKFHHLREGLWSGSRKDKDFKDSLLLPPSLTRVSTISYPMSWDNSSPPPV